MDQSIVVEITTRHHRSRPYIISKYEATKYNSSLRRSWLLLLCLLLAVVVARRGSSVLCAACYKVITLRDPVIPPKTRERNAKTKALDFGFTVLCLLLFAGWLLRSTCELNVEKIMYIHYLWFIKPFPKCVHNSRGDDDNTSLSANQQ